MQRTHCTLPAVFVIVILRLNVRGQLHQRGRENECVWEERVHLLFAYIRFLGRSRTFISWAEPVHLTDDAVCLQLLSRAVAVYVFSSCVIRIIG